MARCPQKHPLRPQVVPSSPRHPEGPQWKKSSECCQKINKSSYNITPVRAIDILFITKFAVDGDFVISRGVFDLAERAQVSSLLEETKKAKEVYRPDAGGLELLKKLWLAFNHGFLLICQLLRNLRGHVTVGCNAHNL